MLNRAEGVPTALFEVPQTSRRPSRPSEQRFTCSQQSVLSAIDRFVKAVSNMDATVLVPSRLRDMEVQDHRKSRSPPPGLHHQDLFSFYSMLKDVKNELLWGPSAGATLFPVVSSLSAMSGMSFPRRLPMTQLRQPSDDGLGSTSCSSDDTDSDFGSVMTDRDSIMEQTSHLATAFRHHLHGLHAILHQLADSADYLSARYQDEVESPIV